MKTLLCMLCLVFLMQKKFICAEKNDGKLEKTSKSSNFKAKLTKELSSEVKSTEKEFSSLEKFANISKDDDDFGIEVPEQYGHNYNITFSHHIYYNATFYMDPEKGRQFWVELDPSQSHVVTHEMLSNSHRQATTVELTFGFPFYGSILNNITIATGGFLYTGDYLHNWIAATQYVAPLMANFDTSQSSVSQIMFADNGTAFTVQWNNLFIQDQMNEGAFSFQSTLLINGDIIFAYKDVPYSVFNITDDRHPVKIGISDAYILERALFFVKRKTIYEYHRIDFLKKNIGNGTAIYFTALPTCATYKNCSSCLSADPTLECSWCNVVQRCSDGIDRNRQNWVINNCPLNPVTSCISPAPSTTTDHSHVVPRKGAETESTTSISTKTSTFKYGSSSANSIDIIQENSVDGSQKVAHYTQDLPNTSGMSVGAIVTLVVFAVVCVCFLLWAAYAYKFPQSSSGQFLIKYRPSQWALRKEGTSLSTTSRHF